MNESSREDEMQAPPSDAPQSGTTTVSSNSATVFLPRIVPRKSLKPIKFPPPEELLGRTTSSQRRLSFLRNVSKSSGGGGAMGRRTSITVAEMDLLDAFASVSAVDDDDNNNDSLNSKDDQEQENVANIAVRRRLRQSIKVKSTLLTPSETGFLEKLAGAAEVPQEQLEAAADVLERDPLYQMPESTIQKRSVSIVANDKDIEHLADLGRLEEQQDFPRPQRDASFRKELWEEFWIDSSSRRLLSGRPSIDSAGSPNSKERSRPKKDKPNNFMYLFQRALLMRDSDDEEEDTADEETPPENGNHELAQIPFWVLGASDQDDDVHPMVLSPPMMDSLRPHMPYACQQDNFWLKYSLIRDGASLHSLLRFVRTSARTILAIETLDGDVFGSFTSSPWRVNGHDYYGSGESFLWRITKSRYTPCETVEEQKRLESDIEVFGWTGKNRNIQLLPSIASDLAIGGGGPEGDNHLQGTQTMTTDADGRVHSSKDWGFGLALSNDLLTGTSQFSVTFGNPSLPTAEKDLFEVANIEIWTMTPVDDEKQAEALELSRQFIFDHGNFVEA